MALFPQRVIPFLSRGVLLAWLFSAAIAFAQSPSGIVLDPSDSPARCLVLPPTSLKYPDGAADLKVGGVVRVKLTFASAAKAPRVEVLSDTVGGPFRSDVIDHVERYRLPCLPVDGGPVVLTQEFDFVPGDGRQAIVYPTRVDDSARGERARGCITGMEQPPEYPSIGFFWRGDQPQGTVIAKLTFVANDQPPEIELLTVGDPKFARVVRDYVGRYRVPCLAPTDLPLKVIQPFRFRMEGAPTRVLKDATLLSFVRNLDHLDSQHVRFDFTTMGCPFEVRFVSWRPYMDNFVGELVHSDPNRREFIEWLRRVDLKIPENVRPMITGDNMTISVPCTVLDLL